MATRSSASLAAAKASELETDTLGRRAVARERQQAEAGHDNERDDAGNSEQEQPRDTRGCATTMAAGRVAGDAVRSSVGGGLLYDMSRFRARGRRLRSTLRPSRAAAAYPTL